MKSGYVNISLINADKFNVLLEQYVIALALTESVKEFCSHLLQRNLPPPILPRTPPPISLSLVLSRSAPPTPYSTGSSTTATEGVTNFAACDTITVKLSAAPSSDVGVYYTTEGSVAQFEFDPPVSTFTSSNWNVGRTISVKAIDDDYAEGSTHTNYIRARGQSSDVHFNTPSSLFTNRLAVTVTDNDNAGFTMAETGTTTPRTQVVEGSQTDLIYVTPLTTP